MSMRSLTTIALQRDQGGPRRAQPKPKDKNESEKTVGSGLGDVLVDAIPTEPLALYTALIGTVVATIGIGDDDRLPLRWALYAAGVVVVAAWIISAYYRSEGKKRRLPVAELFAAVVAFGAWGLVMPQSPLSAELSGDDLTIWTAIITTAAVVLLGLAGRSLSDAVKEKGAG
jgi:hypothetical protein